MPISAFSDVNTVNSENSFVGALGPNQTFVGSFVNVTGYTTITVFINADTPEAASGIKFQWSQDGVTLDDETVNEGPVDNPPTAGRATVHSTIHGAFFRLSYQASNLGQSFTRIQTLFRKGTVSGAVTPVGIIRGRPDAQIVNALSFGQDPSGDFFPVLISENNETVVVPPEHSSIVADQTITATTVSSPQFDFFGLFGATRRFMSVFNDTVRGNLYLKFGGVASSVDYHYKVPPQGTWTMPYSWIGSSMTLFGRWDFADGSAQVTEANNG